MRNKIIRTTAFLFITCILIIGSASFTEAKTYDSDEILKIAHGIIQWKKSDTGILAEEPLLSNQYLQLAGSTAGDWYPIALGRLGYEDDYEAYLAVIKETIQQRYEQNGKLSSIKATEWHRISLAILAMGGDPENIGTDALGNKINLIADGTYNRGKTTSLGRQGINGWIWGLITVDAMRYEIPQDAYYTRTDMILEILRQQLADGGFALSKDTADPDMTAMAVQALAPYYDSEEVYQYQLQATGRDKTKTVRQAIDECVECLSQMQLDTGDYKSWGTQNVESTAQTVIALCSLGIDVQTDERFIKNGNSLIDGIMRYQMADGGFVHAFSYDEENPSSLPDQSNSMAGEQVLCAMTAIWRQQNGLRPLYDFRPEEAAAAIGESGAATVFTEADWMAVEQLPESLTTEQYVQVVKLLDKLQQTENSEMNEIYLNQLIQAKNKIEQLQNEIDSINQEIMNQLYPFEKMSVTQKRTVDDIVKRYQQLSTYDKSKIQHWEDVEKTATKINNLIRGIWISVILIISVLIVLFYWIQRKRRERKKKHQGMEELYVMYEDEE